MTYKYREMIIEDYEEVINVWRETLGIGVSSADKKENIEAFLERNAGLSFVCEKNRDIVGTILCGHDGRRGYLYHLFVNEDDRRNGIGGKLVSLSLDKLKESGIEKCHIYAYVDNKTGIDFWESSGWERRDELCMFSRKI